MYKELKLISRSINTGTDDVPFFNKSADFEWDENGGFLLCDSKEGLEQVILKAILTRIQANGYGTLVQSLKGLKIKTLLVTTLYTEIISSFGVVKNSQSAFYSKFPTFDKFQMLGKVTYIKVYRAAKGKLVVILNVDSQGKLEEDPNPTTQTIRTAI